MTTIRRIVTSKIDGSDANNTDVNEIRPFGETAFYLDTNVNPNKLVLMMFNGQRTHLKSKVLAPGELFGSNANSGDGAGLDTIRLIPDATLYNNGSEQYLIVDPTFPNHIHLRAGGTIDNSSASLYIGGENSYLNIPNGSNPAVNISANNNVWQFGTNGGLTFPDSSVQTTAYTGGADTLDTVTDRGATTTNNITIGTVTTVSVIGASSPVVGFNITGVPFPEGQGAGFTWTWVSSGPEVTQLIAQGSALIGAQVTQSEFPGTLTVLSLPNLGGTLGIELDGAITYSPTNTLTFVSTNYTPSLPLPLDVNVGSNAWTFGTTGTLTLPAGGVIGEQIITSNPSIVIQPADADSIDQCLVIKGGAPPNYNYQNNIGISLDTINAGNGQTVTVTVYSGNPNLTNGIYYWWVIAPEAVTTSSGLVAIDEFGYGFFPVEIANSSIQFRVYVGTVDGVENSDTGVSLLVNEGADPSWHLHLTTGNLTDTSIFLGTDNHSVRTRSNGGIEVLTHDYNLSETKSWLFDKDGKLTFPSGGAIESVGMGWIGLSNGNTNNPVTIVAKDNETGEYRSTVDLYRGAGDDSYVSISTYNPDITTGYQWEFRATGDLRFPDSTLQKTAWAGGRVVSVPGSSAGQTGDTEGDIAFNDSFMYYCAITYSTSLTFDTVLTNDTNSSNVFYIAKTSVPGVPTTGWSITLTPLVPGQTYNIVSAVVSGSNWVITTEPANVTATTGTSVRITRPSVPANIWKRIAWSGDTW